MEDTQERRKDMSIMIHLTQFLKKCNILTILEMLHLSKKSENLRKIHYKGWYEYNSEIDKS